MTDGNARYRPGFTGWHIVYWLLGTFDTLLYITGVFDATRTLVPLAYLTFCAVTIGRKWR